MKEKPGDFFGFFKDETLQLVSWTVDEKLDRGTLFPKQKKWLTSKRPRSPARRKIS
jgi:hypothetical protein